MPNPELSQYHDHDTNTLYDIKDDTARNSINRLSYIDFIVCMIESTGHGSDNRVCYTDLTIINGARFDREKEGTAFRLHCKDNSFLSWTDEKLVYIHLWGIGQAHYIPLYTDATKTDIATVGQLRNKTIDFVYICYNGNYETAQIYMVSSLADSADLSNYYTKTETDNLLSAKVSDNPTFTEASTRANIASGESFAIILGKIKKFFSDLKTVAFTGSYNDLTDTPTIPAAQVNSDWNANSGVAQILNKPTIPDISTKMDKTNPTGSGDLSINRQVGSNVGAGSAVIGYDCIATGMAAVAGGYQSESNGDFAQANNYMTEANGKASTSNGWKTIADSDYQQVGGKFNIADNADTYAEIIGNGSDANNRSNARTLDWSGNETIAGDLYFNGNVTALSSQLSAKADSSSLATVATSGDYDDLLNKPTIPAAQVQADWNEADNTAADYIKNKPSLAAVATSGNYNDLTNKLSAGTNISISAQNEISATDTKPSDYNGQNSLSAVSVANGTSYVELAHVDLTAGTWIINWAASFPSAGSSNTGYRAAGLATTGDPYAYMMMQVPAVANNTFTCLSGSCIYVATGNITLRLKARQYQGTSGSALNVTPRLQAIKIL